MNATLHNLATRPPLTLARRAYEDIIAHARAGKPEEVCGVLRGRGLHGYESLPGRNIAPEPNTNYEIDLKTLLLRYTFEATGDQLIGFYHSHPASPAYPSATDAWNAYFPQWLTLICSLECEQAPVIRAFRLQSRTVETGAQIPIAQLQAPGVVHITLDQASIQAHEARPHSNLFASYHQHAGGLSPVLAACVGQDDPFYMMCALKDDQISDLRVVIIEEHAIELA